MSSNTNPPSAVVVFDWKIALWKAAKAGLASIITILIVNGDFDKIADLAKSGAHIPFYLAPVVAIAIAVIRNYLKQWALTANPDSNAVKLLQKI